ncbi:MAG: GAF domain-containing protein [Candidatus Zixiibacteriota bacterium]
MAQPVGAYGESGDSPVTRAWEKIELIAEISAACRSLSPETPHFVDVLRLIQTVVPFDAATLYLRDSDSGRFLVKAILLDEVAPPPALVLRDEALPDRWKPHLQQPVVWSSGDGEAPQPETEFAAIMLLPLILEDKTIGLLCLGSYSPGILVTRQIKLMAVVADQLAVSIERFEHIARIEAQNQALMRAQQQLQIMHEKRIADEKLAAVAELAASINHQINNPLSVVVGNIDCLTLEEPRLSDKSRERLKRVMSAAMKIAEVNRRLLNIQTIVTDAARVMSPGAVSGSPSGIEG